MHKLSPFLFLALWAQSCTFENSALTFTRPSDSEDDLGCLLLLLLVSLCSFYFIVGASISFKQLCNFATHLKEIVTLFAQPTNFFPLYKGTATSKSCLAEAL